MENSKHNEKLVESLQELLQKNYDAEQGFKKVMVKAENPLLKNWLQKKAALRASFATEIDQELRKLNAEPRRKEALPDRLTACGLISKRRFRQIGMRPYSRSVSAVREQV